VEENDDTWVGGGSEGERGYIIVSSVDTKNTVNAEMLGSTVR
jgi:hypothetical protein